MIYCELNQLINNNFLNFFKELDSQLEEFDVCANFYADEYEPYIIELWRQDDSSFAEIDCYGKVSYSHEFPMYDNEYRELAEKIQIIMDNLISKYPMVFEDRPYENEMKQNM